MALVPIKSEHVFSAGIYDISGNGQISSFTEGIGVGLPTGNLVINNLVMTDQPIKFKFDWGVNGIFAHALNPNFQWRIQIYMEQYGFGEFNLGPAGFTTVSHGAGVPNGPNQRDFTATINIPGGTVPAALYDVVAVIQLYDGPLATDLPCFAAAFAEFNKINFYKEH